MKTSYPSPKDFGLAGMPVRHQHFIASACAESQCQLGDTSAP